MRPARRVLAVAAGRHRRVPRRRPAHQNLQFRDAPAQSLEQLETAGKPTMSDETDGEKKEKSSDNKDKDKDKDQDSEKSEKKSKSK